MADEEVVFEEELKRIQQRLKEIKEKLKKEYDAQIKAYRAQLQIEMEDKLKREKEKLEEEYQEKFKKEKEKLEEEYKNKLSEELRRREEEIKREYEEKLNAEIEKRTKEIKEEYEKKLNEEIKKMEEAYKKEEEFYRKRLEMEYQSRIDSLKMKYEMDLKAKEEELNRKLETMLKERENEIRKVVEEEIKEKYIPGTRYISSILKEKIKYVYPFVAIVGQERMKRALILHAINPNLKGVLLWGPEYTAKSTAIIGFSKLMASVMKGDNILSWDEVKRYLGGVITLKNGSAKFLLDTVLNNASLSFSMEKEKEGHLSIGVVQMDKKDADILQFLNNMPVQAEIKPIIDLEERIEVMRRVREFRKNPESFIKKYEEEEKELVDRIIRARDNLPNVSIPTKMLSIIGRMCALQNVGQHADIMIEELARTNAAYEGRNEVNSSDIMEAADMFFLSKVNLRLSDLGVNN